MTADEFEDYLRESVRMSWQPYAASYGSYMASWVGGLVPTEKRLNLLVGQFFNTAARDHNKHWLVDLDEELAGGGATPTALILSKSWDAKVFDLTISRKLLRLKDEETGQTTSVRLDKGADGVALVLSEIVADFFFPGGRTTDSTAVLAGSLFDRDAASAKRDEHGVF